MVATLIQPMSAKEFREARERLRLSPTEMAEEIGISYKTLWVWEAAKKPIPLTAAKLVRLLVELSWARV